MMLPTVTLDDVELGPRPTFSLRNENRGLTTQRRAAIKRRTPGRHMWMWAIERGSDGTPLRMHAVQVGALA